MKCAECVWYESITEAEGKCRRNTPLTFPLPREQTRILGQPNQLGLQIISYWPQVNGETDFCGAYERCQ